MLSPHSPDNGAAVVPSPEERDAIEARAAFERSTTFVTRMPDPTVHYLRRSMLVGILLLGFVLIPALNLAGVVPDFKVNLLSKYLCFAIAALGIDLIWGYTGLLSLCQALFFCIGGYAMAMHLSLTGDVRPEYHNIPQFMFFNNLNALPAFWKPFASFPFSIFMCLFLPAALAGGIGFLILRSRLKGVYFAIVTQALAWAAWLLISRNEMLLGGTNGLTNFNKAFTTTRNWILGLYLLTLACVVLAYLICQAIVGSRLGRVLIAIRDRESRLYFAGYKPYTYKLFAFAVGAMLAGLGGMLYPAQVGIITPQDMNVEASIFMVIWVAAGGRGKLWGAVYGALLVNSLKSSFSSDLPAIWPFFQGLLFIAVVLFFQTGLRGIWSKLEEEIARRAGALRVFLTAFPLALISLFVLLEALGIQPGVLQTPVKVPSIANPVPVKYLLLFGLVFADGVAYLAIQRNNRRMRTVPAFALAASAGGRTAA